MNDDRLLTHEETLSFFRRWRAWCDADDAKNEGRATPEQMQLLADVEREEREDWVRAEELPLCDRPIWQPYKD